jgi:hypothetical protein
MVMDIQRFDRDDVKKAERAFVNHMSEHLSNFEDYTPTDIDACVEDGYEGFGDNNSIQLFWADE